MPAQTASLRLRYSSGRTWGTSLPTVWGGPGWGAPPEPDLLVRGKRAHRLRDLLRAWHEEVLLRRVERHRGDVRRRDARDGPVEAVERVLGDERRDLRAETAGEVVLVHDHGLSRLADRLEDGVPVEGGQSPQVDDLDADAVRRHPLRRLQRVVRHQAPRKAAELGALTAHDRRSDGQDVIAVGHLLRDEPVHLLVLEEQHRVGVANRRLQQAVRIGGHARHHHLQAGHVGVESLDRLRVVEPAVNPAAERRPDDHGHVPVAVGAVARARGLADDLVEGGVDEVRELDLGDGDEAVERSPDRDADDGRFRQRGVEHARLAELRVQPVGGAEDAAFAAHVLAHDEHALVALHLLGDGRPDGLDHAHLGHRLIPPSMYRLRPRERGSDQDPGGNPISFSADVKNEMAGLLPARPCCQLSELLGIYFGARGRLLKRNGSGRAAYFSLLRNTVARKVVRLGRAVGQMEAKYQTVKTKKRMAFFIELGLPAGLEPAFTQAAANAVPDATCDRKAMLRGLFLGCGSVNAPSARYHLEFVAPAESWAVAIRQLTGHFGVMSGVVERGGQHVVYVKEGDAIVRLLSLMGASRAVMEFENVRVVRSVTGEVNRRLNFETANIDKTIGSGLRQAAAIEKLESSGRMATLPAALREMARWRSAYPELNLSELASRMKLSKSAVNHRLRRLQDLSGRAGQPSDHARRSA